MKLNFYKIIWLVLGLILLGGTGFLFYHLYQRPLPKDFSQPSLPQKPQAPSSTLEEKEEKEPPLLPSDEKPDNLSQRLKHQQPVLSPEAPLSPSVLRVPDEPALPPSEEEIIDLKIYPGRIEPQEITLQKGRPAIFRVKAEKEDHTFVIEELNIREEIKAGKTLVISFRAPERLKELTFYCSLEGHREKGEEGKIFLK